MQESYIRILSYMDDRRDVYYSIFSKIKNEFNIDSYYDRYYNDKFDYDENDLNELFENEDFINDFNLIEDVVNTQSEYENFTKTFLDSIKNNDYKEYELLLTMMYHDQCLLLNTSEAKYSSVNLKVLNEYMDIIKTKEDLINYAENDTAFLHDLIIFFMDFYEFEYFDKRKKTLESRNLDLYFKNIYDFNLLDILYYTKKFSTGDLVIMCMDMKVMQSAGIKCEIIDELQSKILDLYYSDVDNTMELMTALLNNSYKYLLYDVDHNNSNEIKNKLYEVIKNNDLEIALSDILDNDVYFDQILKYFYNSTFLYDSYFIEKVESYFNSKHDKKIKFKKM